MTKRLTTFRINGAEKTLAVEPQALLLDVLREDAGLTGTKRGCDMGTCGCCTVLVDGVARLSCLTLASTVAGQEITTIEGLGEGKGMDPIQRAFHEQGGSQCGFCTPGFIMTTKALLDRTPDPGDHEIREAISGNLCRCTGYVKIIEAIQRAAKERRGDENPLITVDGVAP
ncbi:MAG: aerobic carbon-monoxide dehydrogenase small subunit [Thermoplasmata archaeon]|jgi:aerobic-type carbon monoxide dehydrogenase small subunit (CoxS/CutS family)|nr:aerobic carbon-monoxide dehydrogenase small subunit [Thermoplasmata archaeon]